MGEILSVVQMFVLPVLASASILPVLLRAGVR